MTTTVERIYYIHMLNSPLITVWCSNYCLMLKLCVYFKLEAIYSVVSFDGLRFFLLAA